MRAGGGGAIFSQLVEASELSQVCGSALVCGSYLLTFAWMPVKHARVQTGLLVFSKQRVASVTVKFINLRMNFLSDMWSPVRGGCQYLLQDLSNLQIIYQGFLKCRIC